MSIQALVATAMFSERGTFTPSTLLVRRATQVSLNGVNAKTNLFWKAWYSNLIFFTRAESWKPRYMARPLPPLPLRGLNARVIYRLYTQCFETYIVLKLTHEDYQHSREGPQAGRHFEKKGGTNLFPSHRNFGAFSPTLQWQGPEKDRKKSFSRLGMGMASSGAQRDFWIIQKSAERWTGLTGHSWIRSPQ